MTKKFYITTAIDYVNAAPHLGHAYEKIYADILARWNHLEGKEVYFLTGTDENAQKNVQAAEKAGIPIKKFIDKNSKIFKKLCTALSISNNDFIRTTESRHEKAFQKIFKKLQQAGDIYKGKYEGYYCQGCEAFLTEKDLTKGKCPEHKTKPKWMSEESYFFKLSRYQKQIEKLLSKPDFVWPETRRKEMLNRIKEGLKDLSISRQKINWGIKVPSNKSHIIYVWIDALSNYITALGYPSGQLYKKFWPADIHVVGKGINWFHSVIWSAILLSAKVELPKTILVHGYVTVNKEKISKSIGQTVNPIKLAEKYEADALRYFLIREIPSGEDGDFSEAALKERLNNELAAQLGNLVSRVTALAQKSKLEGKPELEKKLNIKKIKAHMQNLDLHAALKEIWNFVGECNRYVQEKKPWELQGPARTQVLYNLVEALRCIAILISPFMPKTAERINKQLGVKPGRLADIKFGKWKGKVKKGEILFKKVK